MFPYVNVFFANFFICVVVVVEGMCLSVEEVEEVGERGL